MLSINVPTSGGRRTSPSWSAISITATTGIGKIQGVDNATMRLLLSHDWKGNVRELRNAVERAMIFCDRETIGVDDLPAELHGAKRISGLMSRGDLKQSVKEFEKISILSALEEAGYDKRQAAALLGLSKSSLSPDESRDQDP
jgi:transcriptional regulator with PAS, ATPase and Fis domain